MAESVNAEITDELLSRGVNLARLEASMARDARRILRSAERAIIAELNRIDPTGVAAPTFRQRRLNRLLDEVRDILRGSYRTISTDQARQLRELAVIEGQATAVIVNEAVGVDLMTSGLTEQRLRAVADNTLVQGAPAREWWSRQAGSTLQRFTDQMRDGIILNEPLSALRDRTREVTGLSIRQAEALTRTSVLSVANAANMSVYEENEDVLVGWQWVATLDTRTCERCMALSNTIYSFDGRVIEGKPGRFPGQPPLHFNCRCVAVPIVKDLEDLRQERGVQLQRQLDQLEAGERQAIDGDLAPDLTFEQWLRTRSDAEQRRILGQGRYDLWKAGEITIRQLTDQNHRPLTLEELRAA